MNDWIRLHDGGKLHILNPRLNEFKIENIAHALSHIGRFTGHTRGLYVVSQHCCYVCDLLPQPFKLTGLLHDAAEHALNDLNTILKNLVPAYKLLELKHEALIAKRFGLIWPFPPEIKMADNRLLITEQRDLMAGRDWRTLPYKPLGFTIKPWTPARAKREFLDRFHQLYKGKQ